MPTRIIFPFLLLVSFHVYGQKVKVKHGFIYLSKVKMYQIVDVEPAGLLQKHDKAILSIESGDTLVWMKKQQLVNAKAEFETEEKVLDYLDLSFKGRPEVVSMIPRQGDGLYKSLIYERVLSTQTIDSTGIYGFKYNGFPRIYAVELFRSAISQRTKLQAMSGYAAYAKNHTVRSPNAEMVLSNGIVMFKASESSVPVNIGRVETVRNTDGLRSYKIYRNFDNKLVATVEEESRPLTVSINTEFDKGNVSFLPEGHAPGDLLLMSLKYLTDAGYL